MIVTAIVYSPVADGVTATAWPFAPTPVEDPTCCPEGSYTYRFSPSFIEPLGFLIETRNGSVVPTFSVHSWQSNAHTVGSGSETTGSGVGVSNDPENVRTGFAVPSGAPFATGVAPDPTGPVAARAGAATARIARHSARLHRLLPNTLILLGPGSP